MEKWIVGRRALLTLAAFGLLTLGFVLANPAPQAQAASNCTYYSNGSYTTVVGRYGRDCCNNPVAWGVKTKFSICGGCFPCTPPPR